MAGSEIETAAIVNILKNNKDLIVGAVDFHAFSQKVIYPYGIVTPLIHALQQYFIGWTTREPDKVERLRSVTQQVALAASGVCVICPDTHDALLVSGGQDVHIAANG